ncbi:MAG: hypothetical protein MJ198_10240 [Bacteroidales bacterium]|nr:hypothetical protein [Bacteroidales bacterium]
MSDNSVNFTINVNGNANQTITNIGKSMEGLTGAFTRLSAKLTLVNQATSWFSSAAQSMQSLVGTSLEFEQQQANLKTLLNGDEKAMQGLIDKIQDYGVCSNGFSFPVETYLYGFRLQLLDLYTFIVQECNNETQIEVKGKLLEQEYDAIIYCLKNSPSVKRKYRDIL